MILLEILLVEAYKNDKILFEIIKDIENRKKQQKDILLALCDIENRRLKYNSKLYIPDYVPLQLYIL
jgi:hypothetical protein